MKELKREREREREREKDKEETEKKEFSPSGDRIVFVIRF